jgi:hypothetical protein
MRRWCTVTRTIPMGITGIHTTDGEW